MKSAEQIYHDGRDGKYDLDALIKKSKKGEWICWAGMDWKEFDYKKGLDALIKINKTGQWICNAGASWNKFDYEKALKRLKQIGGAYYKIALKDWPIGIDVSIKKTKELEKTSKKLPMKKLKLEQTINSFFEEVKKVRKDK